MTYHCGDVIPVSTVVSIDNCGGVTTTPSHVDTHKLLETVPGEVITRNWTSSDCSQNIGEAQETILMLDKCDFIVNEPFSGVGVNVAIRVTNNDANEDDILDSVKIKVKIDDETYTGDIRGVFFDLVSGSAAKIGDIDGSDHVTSSHVEEDQVDRLANDVTMKGGGKNAHVFDVGVEIGTRGKSKDDIQSVEFVVHGISTDDIDDDFGSFGIRLTSVGAGRDREQSSKLSGSTSCCRASNLQQV
mmetsp:Transcript_18512/g.29827  ORF Transcript_18512/g.29827 Transcript_18512/m.29827 type:complete len:244 (-) Transcript_18512:102-833(-)